MIRSIPRHPPASPASGLSRPGHRFPLVAGLVALALLAACQPSGPASDAAGAISASTAQAHRQSAGELDLQSRQAFEDAERGLIARPAGQIRGPAGEVLIDFEAWGFLEGKAPPTVNPSLWRHAQLNARAGLFKVSEGLYQLRGFDLANMTLIEGRSGWIVVDPLTARESAAAAIAFAHQHLGKRPVSAIVYTHSHGDHFGGVLGVISAQEAAARKIPIIAPEGFVEEATSENLLAGIAMGRRSIYQFGRDLPRSATGNVDAGLGKALAYGTVGLLAPTLLISKADQAMQIDGVPFVFHNMPGAEAPAELSFHLPAHKAYGGAEIVAQTMHNLLPVRGAKVRDALRWSSYLQQALDQLGDTEVVFAQHHWPVWGQARIRQFLVTQRDVYKFTHDQTVRLLNAGLTPAEIADRIRLPASLASQAAARGYYGDLRHNVKAVAQFYLGHYDGNPAHLDPLPPVDAGKRHVALAGGMDKLMAAAQAAYDGGDLRWAAELLNHAVMAQDGHAPAKALLARTYEQMGYAAESSTWRNSYLSAARELREGLPKTTLNRALVSDMLLQTPVERFLEAMAASLDARAAEGMHLKVNLAFTDSQEHFVLWIDNAVLHHKAAPPAPDADVSLSLTRPLFVKMLTRSASLKDILLGPDLSVSGNRFDLVRFFSLLDKPDGLFPIVTR